MKFATMTRTLIGVGSVSWLAALSLSCAAILSAVRRGQRQETALEKHPKTTPADYVSHQSSSSYHMLVESDVLVGSHTSMP